MPDCRNSSVLPPFQNVGRFDFFRYMSRYIAKYMNLEKSKLPTFGTEGVTCNEDVCMDLLFVLTLMIFEI